MNNVTPDPTVKNISVTTNETVINTSIPEETCDVLKSTWTKNRQDWLAGMTISVKLHPIEYHRLMSLWQSDDLTCEHVIRRLIHEAFKAKYE